MSVNKPNSVSAWTDPDDAPELDETWFQEADLYQGDRLIRRGHSAGKNRKVQTTIRFDADLLTAFRSTGKGWQSRMNDALRDWLQSHPLS